MAKFDADGTLLWSSLLGTGDDEAANGIAIDDRGCVFVVGSTQGELGGEPNAVGFDLFLVSFDPDGNIR
ncbi:MAG: SBBP repeat-containing protein [Myxococcota bacterium]